MNTIQAMQIKKIQKPSKEFDQENLKIYLLKKSLTNIVLLSCQIPCILATISLVFVYILDKHIL